MNDLRRCEDCVHFEQQYDARTSTRYNQCFHPQTANQFYLCADARNTFCGISAIYFIAKEPTNEELESIFDGVEDEQPKTPNYDIFSKETEGIF